MKQPSNAWLTNWLENLQRESWQLELIISGFAIVLLLQSSEGIDQLYRYFQLHLERTGGLALVANTAIVIIGGAWAVMLINLCIHVVLRGLWIGTVGLRSISQTINYDQLRYSDQFKAYLSRKVGTYDEYILRLERICSVMFVFSFVVVFALVGFMLCLFALILVNQLIRAIGVIRGVRLSVDLLFVIALLMYFVDFVTLGSLKRIRNRYFIQLYLPIYRFCSLISLAFLYRPVLYNMLDNRYGKRIAWLTLPYILLLMVVTSMRLEGYPLLLEMDTEASRDGGYVDQQFYDDMRKDDFVSTFSIPSKVVSSSYLELFLRYKPEDNRQLAKLCPGLADFSTSVISNGFLQGFREGMTGSDHETPLNTQRRADCIRQLYQVHLNDSLLQNLNQKVYMHPNRSERGILCMLDVADLDRGMHLLSVTKEEPIPGKDSLRTVTNTIPFWLD